MQNLSPFMWRKIEPKSTIVEKNDKLKSEILHIWHVCDVENVAIYAKVMQFLRAFMWRKK